MGSTSSSTQSWEYSATVKKVDNEQYFAGEAGLKGAALKEAKITKERCE